MFLISDCSTNVGSLFPVEVTRALTSIFQKSDIPPKEKWSKVLIANITSSEESGSEVDDIFLSGHFFAI